MPDGIRTLSALILCLCLAFMMFSIVTAFQGVSESCFLVRFRPEVNNPCSVLVSLGLEVVEEIPELDVFVVRTPTVLQSVEHALSRDPRVDFVEENLLLASCEVPNDQFYGFEWHLQKIGAPDAWDISQGNPNTVVAVLDSGVDPRHADLAPRLLSGWNFYDNNNDTSDVTGHGTAVAGVASAVTNNSIGVASIAWQCPILPVKVTDPGGYASYSSLSKGLVYAADKGAKVAVVSFGIYGGSALSSAAKYFMDKGGLVFAAGGNTGGYVSDPDNPYIVSVSGTTSSDQSWGSYGSYIDLSAPCSAIYTTIKGGGYGNVGGTSFSAPLAAGLAALVFSANPSLTPNQVEQIMESTAVDLGDPGYDVYYGWGRINASKALKAAVGTTPIGNSTPPSVAIASPLNGTTVSGGVTVKADASDNVGVSRVDLYKDGIFFASDAVSPYEFYWDTKGDIDGSHTLLAKGYDASNNVGESNPVTVSVSNTPADTTPPSVAITSPLSGATVSGNITVKVDASDNVGVSRVDLYKDGSPLASDALSPYEFYWDTKGDIGGSHTLLAKACDSAGNVGQSSPLAVTVSNTAADKTLPVVSILFPPDGGKVSGFVKIQASAADASGISRVEFYIDGVLKSTAYSASYAYLWNTKSVKDGWHMISVKAYDSFGNYSEAKITVYVSNKK